MLKHYSFLIQGIYFNSVFNNNELIELSFSSDTSQIINLDNDNKHLNKLIYKLKRYLNGEKEDFKDILYAYGKISDFKKKVYQNLIKVEYGSLITYKDLAIKIFKSDKYTRAVANSLATNKLRLIIPCHRVVKADYCIGSYNNGVFFKKYFLELEKSFNFK